MINNKTVHNYWTEEVHQKPVDLNVVSNITSYIDPEVKLSLDEIEGNLKTFEIVKDIIWGEDKLDVVAEYNGIETTVEIFINKNPDLVNNQLKNALKITGANHGVQPYVIKNCLKKSNILVSVAKFDLEKPLVSYYIQNMVLAKAMEFEFLLDMSSQKIFPKEYIKYLGVMENDTIIHNIYTTLFTPDGWMTTIGLTRFHLQELEMCKVIDQKLNLILFKTINTDRLLKGELKNDILIGYGGEEFFTTLSIDDAVANISYKYLDENKHKANHSSNKFRKILIPFSNEKINLDNIEGSIDNAGFEKQTLNFETPEILINKVKSARLTFPYLFDFLKENNQGQLLIEFELETGDKREYIYGKVSSFKDEEFQVELIRDSLHNNDLKQGAKLTVDLSKVVNWDLRIGKSIVVSPVNAYILEVLEKAKEAFEKQNG